MNKELFFLFIGFILLSNYMVYQEFLRLREQEAMQMKAGQKEPGNLATF